MTNLVDGTFNFVVSSAAAYSVRDPSKEKCVKGSISAVRYEKKGQREKTENDRRQGKMKSGWKPQFE